MWFIACNTCKYLLQRHCPFHSWILLLSEVWYWNLLQRNIEATLLTKPQNFCASSATQPCVYRCHRRCQNIKVCETRQAQNETLIWIKINYYLLVGLDGWLAISVIILDNLQHDLYMKTMVRLYILNISNITIVRVVILYRKCLPYIIRRMHTPSCGTILYFLYLSIHPIHPCQSVLMSNGSLCIIIFHQAYFNPHKLNLAFWSRFWLTIDWYFTTQPVRHIDRWEMGDRRFIEVLSMWNERVTTKHHTRTIDKKRKKLFSSFSRVGVVGFYASHNNNAETL